MRSVRFGVWILEEVEVELELEVGGGGVAWGADGLVGNSVLNFVFRVRI